MVPHGLVPSLTPYLIHYSSGTNRHGLFVRMVPDANWLNDESPHDEDWLRVMEATTAGAAAREQQQLYGASCMPLGMQGMELLQQGTMLSAAMPAWTCDTLPASGADGAPMLLQQPLSGSAAWLMQPGFASTMQQQVTQHQRQQQQQQQQQQQPHVLLNHPRTPSGDEACMSRDVRASHGSGDAGGGAAGQQGSWGQQPCSTAPLQQLGTHAGQQAPGATAPASPDCAKKKPGRPRGAKSAASSARKRGEAKPDRSAEGLARRLQELVDESERAQEENRRLKIRERGLSAWVHQMEGKEQVLQIVHSALSAVVHRPPSPATPVPESCSLVSFASVPDASQWDASWVRRLQGVSTLDMLALRRQWLHESAVLLPAAEVLGPDSEQHKRLVAMHGKHISLVQAFVSLCPEAWLRMGAYDMDTLQPVSAPTGKWIATMLGALIPGDTIEASREIARAYRASSRKLQSEFDTLIRQYQSAAAVLGLPAPAQGQSSTGSAHSGPTFDWTERTAQLAWSGGGRLAARVGADAMGELDSTARLVEVNAGRQKQLLKQYLCAMQHSRPIITNVKLGLMMYPLSLSAVDFGRGLVQDGEESA